MQTTPLRQAVLALAAAALTASGCGTVANFASLKPTVYGGVEADLRHIDENGVHLGMDGKSGGGWAGASTLAFYLAIIPAEFCCTFLLDTLTLPITMALDKDWPPPRAEDLEAAPAAGPAAVLLSPEKLAP